MAPVVVFVEGNIGIGKSTLLASLKASLLADAATSDEWDVGLIGAEPARAATIAFSRSVCRSIPW